MTLDMRGFVYELEAVQQRAAYQLEAAMNHVAGIRRTLNELRANHHQLDSTRRRHLSQMTPAATGHIDPALRSAHTQHLVALRQCEAELQAQIAEHQERLTAAIQKLATCNVEVQVQARHREDRLRAFATLQAQRQQSAADQDWLARRPWPPNRSGDAT